MYYGSSGVVEGLIQMLMTLVGAVVISAVVQGFKAEWQAAFKKPIQGGWARVLVYLLSVVFQAYNGFVHGIQVWETVILALLTILCSTGIYHFAKRRWSSTAS